MMNLKIHASTPDDLEITIYDTIGESWWNEDATSAKKVLEQLRAAPHARRILLRINSSGGDVMDGIAIVNLLRERASRGATITAQIDGLAASIAAYLTTAATKVTMPSNAFLMIHEAWTYVRGRAEDLEGAAVVLRKINGQMAESFAAVSARRGKGKTAADFIAAIDKGDVYLTAEEAIAWGLADEETEAVRAAAMLADISTLPSAPAALRNSNYVTPRGDMTDEEFTAELNILKAQIAKLEAENGSLKQRVAAHERADTRARTDLSIAQAYRATHPVPAAHYAQLSSAEREVLYRLDPARFARERQEFRIASGLA